MSAAEVKREIEDLADHAQAATFQRFFKTGPGEYGEGDVFAGVMVPQQRRIAKRHRELPLDQIDRLLASEIHEHRSVGLIILTLQAERADLEGKKQRYNFYLARTERVNNWDLVDLSCREVVGSYLLAKDTWTPLRKLARSELLWDRRIAMVSTWTFIRAGQLAPTFALAEQLRDDEHDLMHKAVGWMLREAGKKNQPALEEFLDVHAAQMPRTALRYSIERLTPERRAYWRAKT